MSHRYDVSFIQKVLRHKSPNTTERYLKSLGIEKVREGLEIALTRQGQVIAFPQEKTLRSASSEG